MWRNPSYPQPEAPAPPAETGERLATFPRDEGAAELRLCRDEWQGRPYLSLRIWNRADDGAMWPSRKGCSVRLGEVARLIDALAAALPGRQRQPEQAARQAPARPAPAGAGAPPRRDPPAATSGSGDSFDEFAS